MAVTVVASAPAAMPTAASTRAAVSTRAAAAARPASTREAAVTRATTSTNEPSVDEATPVLTGYPNSIAAAGDSITRAYNTGRWPFTDAAGNSWSTGGSGAVQSHYLRILGVEPSIAGEAANEAVTGAGVDDLLPQVRAINDEGIAYVTILVGANDVCVPTIADMTPIQRFREQFESAMGELARGSPRARILVLSVPDVYRLWTVLRDSFWARLVWRTFHVCPSLLADPRSMDADDVARRASVRQRTVALNAQLADVCADFIHCRFDRGAVFADPFGRDDVSRRDYFHPSLRGQERLAAVAWDASFDFSDGIAPSSTATTLPTIGGTWVSLDADDAAGVSGIEYRVDRGSFERYVGPFLLASGSELRYRAVDVNGNTEATHVLIG